MAALPPELLTELVNLVQLDDGHFASFDVIDDIDDGRIIVGSNARDHAYGGFSPSRLRELERRGLLEFGEIFRLTDRGRAVVRQAESSGPDAPHTYTDVDAALEHIDLHPAIDARVKRAFESNDPQQAVRDAFGEIEVQVRAALEALGAEPVTTTAPVQLVGDAFKHGGPLATPGRPKSEQDGVAQIYRGAVAAVRNPNAHGRPTYEPAEAFRLVLFADHLLRSIPGPPLEDKASRAAGAPSLEDANARAAGSPHPR